MFAHGIDKTKHEELLRQTFRVQKRLEAALSSYLPPTDLTRRAAELTILDRAMGAPARLE